MTDSTGQDWLRAVEFAARFRSRFFTNTLLIWLQHAEANEQGRVPTPEPTFETGFRQHPTQRPVGDLSLV